MTPGVQGALQINPSFNKSVLSLGSYLEKKERKERGRERRKGLQRKRNILNPVITGSFSCLLSLRFTFNPILANPICLSGSRPNFSSSLCLSLRRAFRAGDRASFLGPVEADYGFFGKKIKSLNGYLKKKKEGGGVKLTAARDGRMKSKRTSCSFSLNMHEEP